MFSTNKKRKEKQGFNFSTAYSKTKNSIQYAWEEQMQGCARMINLLTKASTKRKHYSRIQKLNVLFEARVKELTSDVNEQKRLINLIC